MFYAIDSLTNQWIKASAAQRSDHYVCSCPDRHRVLLKKGDIRTAHFAHWDECRGGGESEEHRAAKQSLRERKGDYSFVKEICPMCKRKKIEYCSNGTVEIEVRSDDKRWWYDCVYKSISGYSIALEVFHTHKTTQEKIEATRQKGMQIAEFRAKEINEMEEGARINNLLAVTRYCSDKCELGARQKAEELRLLKWAEQQLEEERREIERREAEEEQKKQQTLYLLSHIQWIRDEHEKRKAEEQRRSEQIRQEELRHKQKEQGHLIKAKRKKKKRNTTLKPTHASEESIQWLNAQKASMVRGSFVQDDGFTPSRFRERRLEHYFLQNS